MKTATFPNHEIEDIARFIAGQAGVDSVELVATDPIIITMVDLSYTGTVCSAVVFKDGEKTKACFVPFSMMHATQKAA